MAEMSHPEAETPGVDPVADSGALAVDAGEVDAGQSFGTCGSAAARATCAVTVEALSMCCNGGASGWVAPSVDTTCVRFTLGDADTTQACKDVAALPCSEMKAQGLCF